MDDRGYLFIFEDETFLWVDDIDDDDIQAAVDGYVKGFLNVKSRKS